VPGTRVALARVVRGCARWFHVAAWALLLCSSAVPARAYGVLTHLALVDSAWDDALVPALRKRFPQLTDPELQRVHASAYGGALVHDMGYYPGGSRELADLLHYVRSADFVGALLDEAQGPDEYAFALGALAHFVADSEGHPLGVNRVVALSFPELRARFGDVVTYAQSPTAHLRVEFSFDVVQVARGLYPPEAYREFIGFGIPLPLLSRAVRRTYGLDLLELLPRPERAVRSFRKFVASQLPKATRVAWAYKKDEIRKHMPTADSEFVYNLSNAAFAKEWGNDYDTPGLGSRVGAFLLRLVPKFGKLRVLVPKPPTPEGERVYEESFNLVLEHYRTAVARGSVPGTNVNLDVGASVPEMAYDLSDAAWTRLCRRLARADFRGADPALVAAILAHYGGSTSPGAPPALAPLLLRLEASTKGSS
jgi:Zinc dependent phospholipase C